MSVKLLKEFTGYSGSTVQLIDRGNGPEVYKSNYPSARAYSNLVKQLPFKSPCLYEVGDDYVYMEYLPGLEMSEYIAYADKLALDKLCNFIISYVEWALAVSAEYNFDNEVRTKLEQLNQYTDTDLFGQFDRCLPRSTIHGDLTLNNIIFYNNNFYLIDMHPTSLNSIVFDLNKLMQDLDSLWFVRNSTDLVNYSISCRYISRMLRDRFPNLFDNKIQAFMLSRILPYSKIDDDKKFLLREIDKLCK
jgi:hypothetical protein